MELSENDKILLEYFDYLNKKNKELSDRLNERLHPENIPELLDRTEELERMHKVFRDKLKKRLRR